MVTREEIVSDILARYGDKLQPDRTAYLLAIRAELAKRLTESEYLTCADFDHFDV
jgi:hypothetical protein